MTLYLRWVYVPGQAGRLNNLLAHFATPIMVIVIGFELATS